MNQFDALMSQISDLEGVNRDAERKIVAITQHTNSLEADLANSRKLVKEREEENAQLKEKIGTLTIERDAEAKNSARLKSKNQQLKETEATRGKALDEERQAVEKLKSQLRQQLEDSNHENENVTADDSGSNDALQNEASAMESVCTEHEKLIQELKDKLEAVEDEKNKLEENLGETLKEFKKLDDFSTNLQAQYSAIHEWYELFEEWNATAKCTSCDASLDVAAIVDRRLESAKQSSGSKPAESSPTEVAQ